MKNKQEKRRENPLGMKLVSNKPHIKRDYVKTIELTNEKASGFGNVRIILKRLKINSVTNVIRNITIKPLRVRIYC